jgi:hypothetical protein
MAMAGVRFLLTLLNACINREFNHAVAKKSGDNTGKNGAIYQQ